ncbi:uncharacterized protein Z519_10363 [Cladophialophora bantiana CBS 173.52]|uniref:Uncharacterized protein n=1 Tax=Cladophialophora bantiana (strain ATCC 10958 / CBS 173.52 / CDC B-1940 / NIH 8579) TaxID=1442370 RepID=A0A0D2HWE0_CLAB1|nr:uncharacterized protein Z519_10363 [Cladophialophora bantiana CBS 173.52]KIW88879.1 hypothetical protein Z519_10363 [Cladophialophora bantiana CBS 173.52]
MPSIASVAIQSAILKAAANLTAQTLTIWNAQSHIPLDWARVVEFAAFGTISAPLASLWQRFLEDSFPGQQKVDVGYSSSRTANGSLDNAPDANGKTVPKPQLNWPNIFIKLVLDQTIGQFLINVTFLICTNSARLQSWSSLVQEIHLRIFGVIWASWTVWPWVSLVNFIWVPVEWRVLVASLVGFGWNIFLSILSMREKT